MTLKAYYILFFNVLALFSFNINLFSQENFITINARGDVLHGDVLQSRIKLKKHSFVSIIDVDYESSIIEVIDFKSKKIVSNHYFGKTGYYKKIGHIIDFRKSPKKDINTIDTSLNQSIKLLYYSPVIKTDFDIVYSIYNEKLLCLIPCFIQIVENDSIYKVIEGHDELKRNLSVACPKFYDNGKKIAYIAGDEYSTKRHIVFYDLVKKIQISKVEVDDKTTIIQVSKNGDSCLFFVPYNNKYCLYDIYYITLYNNDPKYIGRFKAARLD